MPEDREPNLPSENQDYWRISLRPLRTIPAHALLFSFSLFVSFLLVSDMRLSEMWFPELFLKWLMITLVVKLIIFGVLHQYQGWWRYVSVLDLFTIMRGAFISAIILTVGYFGAMNIDPIRNHMGILERVPQAVLLLDCAGTIVVVCGARMAFRLYYEETQTVSSGRLTRILIVGAGNAGEALLREIHRMSTIQYEVAGFVDDDPRKLRVRIHGIPVLGRTDQIKAIAQEHNVDEIAIAMPSATHKELRRVIVHCEGTSLRFSTVPNLVEIATGKVRVSQMRNVDINDLLGRDPVKLETDLISKFAQDKVVMITGAGGSIGSEMCRQVGEFKPKQLLLVEQAENALFFIERELSRKFPHIEHKPLICDVADFSRVEFLFAKYHPNVVIHAAAHKHVPMMEVNPGEAIKNNVIGTRNVAQAADQYGAGHFVFISTDKAVNPTSIMGSSKRLAEMSIQCLNKQSKTDYVTVRFGNVLGSNGSVIPLFQQQIANGGPVTVTHPDMQRYFMTIPEASQLVLQAAAMGHGGEILLLDMGEPVKILDLARDLITLSGFRVGDDIEIKTTGIRPGEKLYEELATTGENMQPTRHPKIAIWQHAQPDDEALNDAIEKLKAIADAAEHDDIVKIIKEVIPEYVGDVDSQKLHDAHMAKNGENHVPPSTSDTPTASQD
jgi:FlaA1/EpsC-like NDP-sugar epimerase